MLGTSNNVLPATVARSYDLGPMGHVIEINPAEFTTGVKTVRPHVTVILDRSGSMAQWVKHTRNAVNTALLELGFANDDRLSLITFDDVTERVMVDGQDPTVEDLVGRLSDLRSRGCTNMAGVALELENILSNPSHQAHKVIVVSDGAVFDREETVLAVDNTIKKLHGSSNVLVNTVLIRLMTSAYADPDTRALACFGSFCNDGKAFVTDIAHMSNQSLEQAPALTIALIEGISSVSGNKQIELRVAEGVSRLPTLEPETHLLLPCGRTTHLFLSESTTSIQLGDESVPVTDMGTPSSDDTFRTLFDVIEQRLKMWSLMGSRDGDISGITKWFDGLQTFLDAIEEKTSGSNGGEIDLSLRARTKAMVAKMKKRQGSVIDRIRQLGNSDKVANLNSQQQADWLRGAQDTASSRQLAKRAHNTANGELDYDIKAISAIRELANVVPEQDHADMGIDVSFFSQSTAMESLQTAHDLLDPCVTDDISIGDVLQCVGGVGIPFEAHVGNYVDPWSFRVIALYHGQSLAEADISLARNQAGRSDNVLKCPGQPESNITGVVACMSSGNDAYKHYTSKEVRSLFQMQASVQMRGMVACVPYDAVALNTAAAWNIIQTLGVNGKLSEVESRNLCNIIDTLRYLIGEVYQSRPFEELYESMCGEKDVRPWLSGDRDVSGVLRPIAVLLKYLPADEAKSSNDRSMNVPNTLRALYYLEAYFTARKIFRNSENTRSARTLSLMKLLDVDLEAHATPLMPLFESEPEEVHHYDQISLDSIGIPDWMPSLSEFIALESVLRGRNKAADASAVYGCPGNVLRAVATVQAIKFSNQSERIDAVECVSLIPDPTTETEGLEYIKSIIREFYAADYESRLVLKRKEEASLRLQKLVVDLVATSTYIKFEEMLVASTIVNKHHEGFELLTNALLEDNTNDCSTRAAKLYLLTSGRNMKDPEVEVWDKGNFIRGGWNNIKHVIEQSGDVGEKMINSLLILEKKYGRHQYREKENRHGHSNEFLSYWALGYQSLAHMKTVVSDNTFRSYFEQHSTRGCCGC
eukprot:CFRG2673T1